MGAVAQQEARQPSPVVRTAVRDLLSSSQAFHGLAPEERKAAAQAMVKVCQTAVSLMQEEAKADQEVNSGRTPSRPRGMAAAQSASALAVSCAFAMLPDTNSSEMSARRCCASGQVTPDSQSWMDRRLTPTRSASSRCVSAVRPRWRSSIPAKDSITLLDTQTPRRQRENPCTSSIRISADARRIADRRRRRSCRSAWRT